MAKVTDARRILRNHRRITERFLAGLGEPEPEEFRPSPFQEKALAQLLEGHDVMVTAPTGSGKTWIAEQAIRQFLEEGRVAWYTSPLKALSNQKYERFKELYGAENVGLLTGERRENAQAPIIVATTEVLRNALYEGEVLAHLIVLDEAHYLGDPDRGTTWEEVIVLAPGHSRLLLLSATISNARELADWILQARGRQVRIVTAPRRPVPLRFGFLDREYHVLPLQPRIVFALPDRYRRAYFDPVRVVETLGRHNLLPAIVFLPRRRDCDGAVSRFYGQTWEGQEERTRFFTQTVGENRYLWRHPLLGPLLQAGVASHHAGHLTGWKVAVEQMLARGMIRAVFATTTLAAGLDVPARTVVMPTMRVRQQRGTRNFSALEFHQMTGRAGRRGKDRVGFVIVVPRIPRDLETALKLKDLPPEPLQSSFTLAYYQVLNLFQRFGREGTLRFLESSFYLYQRGGKRARRRLFRELDLRANLLKRLGYLNDDNTLTEYGRWAMLVRHERSLIVVEMVRRELYEPLSPAVLAGWVAAVVGDRAPYRLAGRVSLEPLKGLVSQVERLEEKMGIEPLGLIEDFLPDTADSFRAGRPGDAWRRASAVRLWADGEEWERVIRRSEADEGDFQRLVLQTAEVLRELEDLPFPDLTLKAREARQSVMREPVL